MARIIRSSMLYHRNGLLIHKCIINEEISSLMHRQQKGNIINLQRGMSLSRQRYDRIIDDLRSDLMKKLFIFTERSSDV